jgi:hypothetical protein
MIKRGDLVHWKYVVNETDFTDIGIVQDMFYKTHDDHKTWLWLQILWSSREIDEVRDTSVEIIK